jgi:VanZ family protein
MQTKRLLRLAAWCALGLIAFATLSPIGLRPGGGLPPQVERFGAFFIMATMFGLAYRERPLRIALLVLGSAAALELLQLLAPGRHGMLPDAGAKLAGAALGLGLAWAAAAFWKALPGRR